MASNLHLFPHERVIGQADGTDGFYQYLFDRGLTDLDIANQLVQSEATRRSSADPEGDENKVDIKSQKDVTFVAEDSLPSKTKKPYKWTGNAFFLNLPSGVRQAIYQILLLSSFKPGGNRLTSYKFNALKGLLIASKLTYKELSSILFTNAVFEGCDGCDKLIGLNCLRMVHPELQAVVTLPNPKAYQALPKKQSRDRSILKAMAEVGVKVLQGRKSVDMQYDLNWVNFKGEIALAPRVQAGIHRDCLQRIKRSGPFNHNVIVDDGVPICAPSQDVWTWWYRGGRETEDWFLTVLHQPANGYIELIGNVGCLKDLWEYASSREVEQARSATIARYGGDYSEQLQDELDFHDWLATSGKGKMKELSLNPVFDEEIARDIFLEERFSWQVARNAQTKNPTKKQKKRVKAFKKNALLKQGTKERIVARFHEAEERAAAEEVEFQEWKKVFSETVLVQHGSLPDEAFLRHLFGKEKLQWLAREEERRMADLIQAMNGNLTASERLREEREDKSRKKAAATVPAVAGAGSMNRRKAEKKVPAKLCAAQIQSLINQHFDY